MRYRSKARVEVAKMNSCYEWECDDDVDEKPKRCKLFFGHPAELVITLTAEELADLLDTIILAFAESNGTETHTLNDLLDKTMSQIL